MSDTMKEQTMDTMKARMESGKDPLTGRDFATCPPNSVSNRDGVLRCDGCGGRVQLEDGQWVHARCLHSGCNEPVAFRATKLYGDHSSFYTCTDHEPGRSRMEGIPIAYRVEPVR